MCVEGWKERALNPSRIAIVTREYPHSQEFVVEDPIRGGPKSGEHVDILGNVNVMEDVLRIVTDYHPQKVKTRIVSDIENIASRIRAHPGGPRPPRGFPFHLYNGNKRKPLISIE
jgi:phospholipid:diacylglycerol acyltransferase